MPVGLSHALDVRRKARDGAVRACSDVPSRAPPVIIDGYGRDARLWFGGTDAPTRGRRSGPGRGVGLPEMDAGDDPPGTLSPARRRGRPSGRLREVPPDPRPPRAPRRGREAPSR